MQHDAPGGPERWCLVLAIWGQKRYGSAHVNNLARRARALSPSLAEVVLFTDHPREGIDPDIRQTLFPDYFARAEFFSRGYRAKLAVFTREVLPRGRRCLYVDLDSVVMGDLGRIAALVRDPEDVWMMPPAGIGFSVLRRLGDLARGGRHFPVGNSSLVAFHADDPQNIAEAFRTRHASGVDLTLKYMRVDDVFISWQKRGRVRGIPISLAVYFRREFMARSRLILWLRSISPLRRKRREGLVAVTFNGLAAKPEQLAALPEGSVLRDKHGRFGYWSDDFIGPVRQETIASCRPVPSDT